MIMGNQDLAESCDLGGLIFLSKALGNKEKFGGFKNSSYFCIRKK